MTINLNKGERINLSKETPNLKQAAIGLGWKINQKNPALKLKLDVYVFMLGSNGKIPAAKYLVFSENQESLDGSISYNLGNLDGDSQTIKIDLNKIDNSIQELVFIVTIHKARERKQSFNEVDKSYLRIYDHQKREEIAKYQLEEKFLRETGVEFGRLYRKDNQWRFQAVGSGYNAGLEVFADKYI